MQVHKHSNSGIFSKLMKMDEATWARHANPFSVWSRLSTSLPALLIAVWSIKTLGAASLISISLVCLWIWLNPRLFPAPQSTNNWASKVTFGERIWLNRKEQAIPLHHAQWALFLSLLVGLSFFISIYGAYQQNLFLTLNAGLTSWIGKMWFCDRMVWLYEDMKFANPQYKSWLQ